MDKGKVTLVPKGAGGYFVKVLVERVSEEVCLVSMKGSDLGDFETVLGIYFKNKPEQFPLKIDDVVIRLTTVQYEIVLSRGNKKLNFNEVVEFFKAKSFKEL